MNLATKKWVFLKLSSIILVPLMFWFIINFISIYDGDYSEVVSFFSNKTNKFIFSIFLYFVEILEQEYEADPMLSIDLFLSTATWIIPRL